MNCQDLAKHIERLRPEADIRDVARLCLLLVNTTKELDDLQDDQFLTEAWRDVNLRVQATADQHAAMTQELDDLAKSDPKQFTSDQIWVLIRAIKVQSQILQMYIGDDAVTV